MAPRPGPAAACPGDRETTLCSVELTASVAPMQRFKPKARNKAKVKVDERFQRMFEDEDFATGGSSA